VSWRLHLYLSPPKRLSSPSRQVEEMPCGDSRRILIVVLGAGLRDRDQRGPEQRRTARRQRRAQRRTLVSAEQPGLELLVGAQTRQIGNATFRAVSALSPRQVADFFQEYPSMATFLLTESENKRFTPSRFITHRSAGGFSVGWLVFGGRRLRVRSELLGFG
jgi:hypothetical protein